MSDTDKVLEITKKIEHLLEYKYGAVGRGLHEKISKAEVYLTPELVKDLRKIATIRNKLFHVYNYNFSKDRHSFFQIGESAIIKLQSANAIYSQSSAQSSFYQGRNNYLVNTNRSWKKGILAWQWLIANIYGAVVSVIVTGIAVIVFSFVQNILAPVSNNLNDLILGISVLSIPFCIIHLFQQSFLVLGSKKASLWWLFSTIGYIANLLLGSFILIGAQKFLFNQIAITDTELIMRLLIPITGLPLALTQWLIFKQQGRKATWWIPATIIDWTIFIGSWFAVISFNDVDYFLGIGGLVISLIVGKIITGLALSYVFSDTV